MRYYDHSLDTFYATNLLKLRVIAENVGNLRATVVALAVGNIHTPCHI
jgi:hypothetical protein